MLTHKNGKTVSTPVEIFERHVVRNDGCWEWRGFRNKGGYGFTRIGGRGSPGVLAHRLSWQIHHGEIPKGLHVLHRCDNPGCVRPDHLFLGTNGDNILDRISKGRRGGGCFKSGDDSPTVRWSEAVIAEMRAKRAAGARVIDISNEYGIQRDYLSRILNNRERRSSC